MTSKRFDNDGPADDEAPSTLRARPLKIVIAGGFAAGKTTLVDALSEITPLTTEAPMTSASIGLDDHGAVGTKTTTTVAMDFGRITLGSDTVLYLFGTPGQDRFWFMWEELARGAVGAVVLVDSRRIKDCFPALDFFEERGLPYVVALNCFDGEQPHTPDAVRRALSIDDDIPIIAIDARDRASTKEALVTLVGHAIDRKLPAFVGRPS